MKPIRKKLPRVAVVTAVLLAAMAVAAPAYAAPANDAMADAAVLPGLPHAAQQSTAGATTEPGEPAPSCAPTGASVWYRLEPEAAASALKVKTFGSKFDTVLAAYAVATDGTLTELACNDDAEDLGSVQSVLTASVPNGQAVLVLAGGYEGATGSLKISFDGGDLDDFETAMSIGSLPFTHTVSTGSLTAESGEPDPCGITAEHSAWFRYTASSDGLLRVTTAGSSFDTVLAVYTGSSLASLQGIACSDDSGGGFHSTVVLETTAGQTYHLQADGFYGETGTLVIGASALDPPTNDDFEDAVSIAAPAKVSGDNTGATTQDSEPESSCWVGGSTVWYRFDATETGPLVARADTDDWMFYPVTAVYRGDSLEELRGLGCGYPENGAGFVAVAGETYWIQVGSYWEGEYGEFELTLRPGASVLVDAPLSFAGASAETDGENAHVFAGAGTIAALALAEAERGPDGGEAVVCAGALLITCVGTGLP